MPELITVESFSRDILKLSNGRLIDRLIGLTTYSPAAEPIPDLIKKELISIVKREILSRMKKHIMATELHRAIMNRDDVSLEAADELVQELKDLVKEGGDPEELLFNEGFEPDYVFDIINL
jgi:hypothetical protein